MRYRFTGAVVAMTLAAAVSLTVTSTAQQGRGNAPAAPAAGQGRGARRTSSADRWSSELQRCLAGGGLGPLEPRGSFRRGDAVLAVGRDVRDSCRSERDRRWRHDPVSSRRR